jgi:large subunit ribosomal protein L10
LITQDKVLDLAKLPSKEELLAKTVGTMKGPINGFVNALSGNLRNLVGVINAIQETKS